MAFNRSHLWIAYVPLKLHKAIPAVLFALGYGIGTLWRGLNVEFGTLGLIAGVIIGIPLQNYKVKARTLLRRAYLVRKALADKVRPAAQKSATQ